MFEGLERLRLALERDEKNQKLNGSQVNREFTKRKRPGPKIDFKKRVKKIEALSVKLNCQTIVESVIGKLIDKWFLGCEIFSTMSSRYNDFDDRVPLPHWYVFKNSDYLDTGYPKISLINVYLQTIFRDGKPIYPKFEVETHFNVNLSYREYTQKISEEGLCKLIIKMFEKVYGEYAKKKGIQIN